MGVKKNGKTFTGMLFGAAVLLLGAGAAGSSRAALTYYNDNYRADLQMSSQIGVEVTCSEEPGTEIFREGDGALPIDREAESLIPGRRYPLGLGVENTGKTEAYMRVTLRFYWRDAEGKRRDVDPDLIRRTIGGGWLEDEAAATREQAVYYCVTPVKAGERKVLVEDVSADLEAAGHVTWNEEGTATFYDYDGLTLVVEAEADAVQTHNAAAAMESAWGKKVSLENRSITGFQGKEDGGE